jgi:PAS domain S-box-containing protein
MSLERVLESRDSGTLPDDERKVLELIAVGAPLGTILDSLCRFIDEQSGLRSSIFLLDAAAERLTLTAGPHLPEIWRQAVASFPVTVTACGAAVTRRVQTVSEDIATDPSYDGLHDVARQADIRAVWSTPFFSKDDRPLGTFAVYNDVPGPPSALNLALVRRATQVASIAVDRHLAEARLRESELRFSTAFYANPACMTITRCSDGRFLYVNDAFLRMFGYSRAEAVGQTALSLGLYAEPAERPRLMQLLAQRKMHDVEARARTRSGHILDLVVSMERIEVQGEESVLQIAVDITELKRVNEQLRSSEQALSEAQRVAQVGSWTWDVPNRGVTWSDELYRLFGVEPGGFDPINEAMAFIHSDDRDLVSRAIQHTLLTKEPYSFFYRITRRDGEERILHSCGYVVSDEHGNPASVFGTTQDVTERKQAEDALRRSEQLLRLVLEAIPVGVAVVDPGGNIILSNPASVRIWGSMIQSGPERYARSQAWWHDGGEKIEPEEWASWRALTKGETTINEVIDIEAFDGVRKVMRNSAVPIRDDCQAIVGAVVINEDVSAQKTAERELEASVTEMQTLAARLMDAQDDERRRIAQMLHETTAQDLAAVKMLLARLNRTGEQLSDADRALLSESIELADRSMNGVRTLSYLLHPPFLDENGLLSAVRWYAGGFAERSGIEVVLDLPETFERLSQDAETTLFRVVQEALINVHRYARSATAHIRLRNDAGRLTLEINDRGRGMPADLVSRLMAGGGADGVGIASMRERLKQLGGTLEIESSDSGTTLRAVVPGPTAGR